jgi:hypothetical protein
MSSTSKPFEIAPLIWIEISYTTCDDTAMSAKAVAE